MREFATVDGPCWSAMRPKPRRRFFHVGQARKFDTQSLNQAHVEVDVVDLTDTNHGGSSGAIRGVINAVHGRYRVKFEGIYAFQAPDVVSVLVRIRTSLMVCVNPALATEIVLRRPRIELIHPE